MLVKEQDMSTKLPPIPAALDTPAFREAWADWQQHRREIKHKLTPLTAKRQFSTLAKIGPEAAIKVIEMSIEKGWQGLFPEQVTKGGTSPLSTLKRVFDKYDDGTLDKEFGT